MLYQCYYVSKLENMAAASRPIAHLLLIRIANADNMDMKSSTD